MHDDGKTDFTRGFVLSDGEVDFLWWFIQGSIMDRSSASGSTLIGAFAHATVWRFLSSRLPSVRTSFTAARSFTAR